MESDSLILKRILYRFWQFYKAVFPRLDVKQWNEVENGADNRLVPLLRQLGKAEKAHVLRILQLISNDNTLTDDQKEDLFKFAVVHDIGKAITKPTILFKVAKVLLKLSSDSHCIAGCKAVWRLTKDKKQALRVLKHHIKPNSDSFLALFQQYDDQA